MPRHRLGSLDVRVAGGFRAVCLGLGLAVLAGAASAAPAFVATRLSLRAGPGQEYPAVALLEPGVQVEVLGCLEQYDWCDVGIGQDRGWVPGGYLQAPYAERREALPSVGPMIGLPIVGFSVGSYWGSHYRGRSWYGERERWDRPAFHRPPPGWGRDRPDFGRHDFRHDGRGPWRDGPGRDGPGRDGPWRDGPGRDGPGRGGPGPSRFEGGRPGHDGRGPDGPRGPDRGGPDRGGPGRGGPDRGGPGRGGPDRGGPDRGGPDRGGPDRGGPDRGGPDRGGPPR